jgi:hypothetical protein
MFIEGVLNGDRILNFMDSFDISCEQDRLIGKITFSYKVRIALSLEN